MLAYTLAAVQPAVFIDTVAFLIVKPPKKSVETGVFALISGVIEHVPAPVNAVPSGYPLPAVVVVPAVE